MLLTAFIVVYVLIFIGALKLDEIFGSLPPEKRPILSAGGLVLLGLPWVLTVVAGTFWGFISNPPDFFLRMPENGYWAQVFLPAIMAAVPLSYLVAYTVGSQDAHRKEWPQVAIAFPPHLISATQIGFYRWPDDGTRVGEKVLAGGRTFKIVSVTLRGGLSFVVAEGMAINFPEC